MITALLWQRISRGKKHTFMTQQSLLNFFKSPAEVGQILAKSTQVLVKGPADMEIKTGQQGSIITEETPVSIVRGSNTKDTSSISSIPLSEESTDNRLVIHDILKVYFFELMKKNLQEQLLYSIYLSLNRVGPIHEGLELGLGESILIKAVATATGKATTNVKSEVSKLGDLGKVLQNSRQSQSTMSKPKPLTLSVVFKTLREISMITGASAIQRKCNKVQFLLVSCQLNEPKYLIRSLEGKLRIGLAEQSLLIALAQASVLLWNYKGKELPGSFNCPEDCFESAVAIMKSVYSEIPVYEKILPAIFEFGIFELEKHCQMTPGIPIKPMLAHPTKSLTEVLDRFEKLPFTCEYKYDGERAQIHSCADGKMMVFSRNLENMSEKYPDIIEKMNLVQKEPSVKSFVLDCEAVAWNPEDKKTLPFQVLSTRKRKDVLMENIKVQICLFGFDLLYLNGKSLLKDSFKNRRALLHSLFSPSNGHFQFAKSIDSHSIEEIQGFLEESVKENCEGLMVKTLEEESSYEPSKRSRNWLKVKKDYLSGVGDSLDLVVLGGYYGRGKRTGVYGGFLLACYDDEGEVYQPICKIGTGFSESDLENLSLKLKELILPAPKAYYDVTESIKPDVWFDAAQVWEVKAADFSISPLYSAAKGKVDFSKGISLRFPRFIKIREDKIPEQATTSTEVAELYQAQNVNSKPFNDLNDEEDY